MAEIQTQTPDTPVRAQKRSRPKLGVLPIYESNRSKTWISSYGKPKLQFPLHEEAHDGLLACRNEEMVVPPIFRLLLLNGWLSQTRQFLPSSSLPIVAICSSSSHHLYHFHGQGDNPSGARARLCLSMVMLRLLCMPLHIIINHLNRWVPRR